MVKKALSRLRKIKWRELKNHYWPRLRYPTYYKKLPIDEHAILLESSHGNQMQGNIFYLLKVLATDPKYQSYRIYLSAREKNADSFRERLDNEGLQRVELAVVFTRKYMKLIASAKYLINDTTFLPFFVKRPEQIYLNTWHGTPLKTLGKKVNNDLHNIGNVQKNFFMADYLLYPNTYTMEHMVEDYMLENLSKARILLTGYPRNAAFFDVQRAAEIRAALEIENKRVYAFMPTWRGVVGGVDRKASTYVQYYLYEMDKRLQDDEILYVNLHPLARKDVSYAGMEHIRPFPEEYETYEFLNAADCLITDYSSVFYDFAVTRKKCILFTYDEEEYFADRGLYRPLSSLPFPSVKTVDALFDALRSPKDYDDTAFLQEYCPYDSADAAEKLCARVILNEDCGMEEREISANGKRNVLLYVGNLAQNGITTSILNLLQHVDRQKYNFYITFITGRVRANKAVLQRLPEGTNYIATTGKMNLTFWQKVVYLLFMARLFPLAPYMRILREAYPMEIRRNYGDAVFSDVIQFNGYETKKILLFSTFRANRVIYVHNDMEMEIRTRGNQRRNVLRYAYDTYDKVAVVTEDIVASTKRFLTKDRTLNIARNLIADGRIRRRGGKPIAFDPQTRCNVSFEELMQVVGSDAKRIVSVGRFSPEKGHQRLMDAFNRVWQENPESYLIIIGGNQRDGLYPKLCDYAASLPCGAHVILILSMSNPFPLVKACDGFILSSFYEGFGLVLAEADILGLPIVSTDITGPRRFMQENGGTLVANTQEGLEDGLRRLLHGQIPKITVDYDAYNRAAVEEFYNLLDKDGKTK